MIIEIKDDGAGAWNLTAKADKDTWPPMYMAHGRTAWAINALVRGILSDFEEPSEPPTAADHAGTTADTEAP